MGMVILEFLDSCEYPGLSVAILLESCETLVEMLCKCCGNTAETVNKSFENTFEILELL